MEAGLVYAGRQPQGCAVTGVPANSFSFRTSDPGVLREDSRGGWTATFQAVAPGTARVFAEGLPRSGRNDPVELSICIDPSTYDDKNCARTPLVILVVP